MAVCPDVWYNTLAEPSGMGWGESFVFWIQIIVHTQPVSVSHYYSYSRVSGGLARYFVTQRLLRLWWRSMLKYKNWRKGRGGRRP